MSFGVRTSPFCLVSPGHENDIPEMDYPVIVKPNAEGSGKGISEDCIAQDRDELTAMLKRLFADYKQDMLVETFLSGREFTVGLLGTGDDVQVFPPMEIVYEHPTQGDYCVYSYKIKKEFRKHVHYECPSDIPEALTEMTEAARTIFNALGCRDLARIDFRMDKDGCPCFLEINPLPGLAPNYSDFPMAAEAVGPSYDDLIAAVAESALSRIEK
jgi:D-alanine-D-alanine ligase